MTETKQKLPEWFNGSLYTEGLIVENPFSKEEYELNNVELSMYDFLVGCSRLKLRLEEDDDDIIKDYEKGIRWFRQNNPEAYMALLD